MQHDCRYVVREKGTVIAVWRENCLIQARRGVLTPSMVRALRDDVFTAARMAEPFAALLIVEDGAPIPGGDVRPMQRALVSEALRYPSTRIAAVTLGTSINARLARSAGRLVTLTSPHVAMFDAVRPAAVWLAHEFAGMSTPLHADQLFGAAEALRADIAGE